MKASSMQRVLVPLGGGPAAWAARINAHLTTAVEAIVATGQDLLAAKAALKHGEWERLFADHPKAVAQPVQFTARTARMLMAIAQHPLLSNRKHVSVLPPSWGTLYELTKLPPPLLQEALTNGRIHADLERADVRRLVSDDGKQAAGRPARDATVEDALHLAETWLDGLIDGWRYQPDLLVQVLENAIRRARKHFAAKED